MDKDKKNIVNTAIEVLSEEAKTIFKLAEDLKNAEQGFYSAVSAILDCKGRLITTGMGKSGIIATKISATLASTGTPSFFLHPAEALHGDLGRISEDDLVLALSHSGNTEEVLKLIPFIRQRGASLISITGNENSALASLSDISLLVAVNTKAPWMNLAPTASTTGALALGDALAISLCIARGFQPEDFANLHPGGSLGRKMFCKIKAVMHTGDKMPTVSGDKKAKEAIDIMTKCGFGAVLIVKDQKAVGIITDGDLRRIICDDISRLESKAQDIAKGPPKLINQEKFIGDGVEIMEKYQITTLGVIDDKGLLTGIVNLHDLLGRGAIKTGF